ncbi:zinc finger RNA-binding protein-like isoform X2 [Dendronephthya gigantea]|uniref:zinc finger RNA-binding protein-like isoform X2 n=1 Tax=Dendronephthya gigantea TaxID=151771 RepID=UPI00106C058D|nr:zinc finger RNA-binding protein-like isoform X2 [Dendronephthya gigantea]
MAQNSNYYGYSAGVQGSQVYGNTMQNPQMTQSAYSGQTTAAYGAQSTTPSANAYGTASPRSVMPGQSAYTPTAASNYQTTALSGSSYGYTARVQDTSSQSYPTNAASAYTSPAPYYGRDNSQQSSGYDASKANSYYNQHSGTTPGYGYGSGASKSMYSGYSTQSNANNQMANPSTPKASTQASGNSNVSYPYKGQTGTNYNQNSSSYNSPSNWSGNAGGGYQPAQGYDAAVYNAASSYFQQQTQPRQKWGGNKNNNSGNQNNKPGQSRQRNPPRQQQVHYCDVCKISCAGPQTYKEHLEGQKHKKKEAAQKQMEAAGPDGYRCSLCDVTCTGTDAFNAHLKGAKHLKTVKLHEKLGKPIPEVLSAEDQDKDKKKDGIVKTQTPKPSFRNNQRRNRKPSAPKITFIGGATLNSTPGETATTSAVTSEAQDADVSATMPDEGGKKGDTTGSEEGKDIKFVGEDYIEEVKSDAGKVIGFECKLCECKFNDTLAREAHLKGRRHQLAYKKVQPDFVVDQKPSARNRQPPQPRSLMDDKARRRWEQDMYWRQQEAAWRNEEVRRWGEEEYWRRLEEEERMWDEHESHRHGVDWGHRMGPPRPDYGDMYPPPNMPRPRQDSQDDRMVMAKHKQIYPNEQELSAVQSIVSAVEKALKLVSDSIAEEEAPLVCKVEVKDENMEVTEAPPAEEKTTVKEEKGSEEKPEEEKAVGESDEKTSEETDEKKDDETKKSATPKLKEKTEQAPRTLKGVMRVGVLAKGLLLHERLDVQLVVLCQDRPTVQLLERVSTKLPDQLTKVSDEKYDVVVENCQITVASTKDPKITVLITLTSPVMRDEADVAQAEEQKDVLDRDKCLEALASLRHAKWFQAKANGVPSCVVIIRILRDMRDRLPVFVPLSSWALELLVEKCLSSADYPLGPGEAFRRVLECISSGVLLPGGPGLHDPCEKEVTDASAEMTAQEREDITSTAQNYLRLHAFRQLHKVLGIDPIPASKFRGRYGRGARFKRRREDSGLADGSAKKEKKDGEEEGEGKDGEVTPETTSDVSANSETLVENKQPESLSGEAAS